jgi:hypothetical protein
MAVPKTITLSNSEVYFSGMIRVLPTTQKDTLLFWAILSILCQAFAEWK